MSFNNALEPTLHEILDVIKPLREDWESRCKVIEELRNVVQSIESLRGATIEPFGSFVSNLFTRWGDLDLSVELSGTSCISSAGKKRKQSLLGELLRALRQRGGWNRFQFIPHARVPILKIESNIQRISCDISIDNMEGQLKSKFLFWISEIDGRYRDMVLLVKEWAKANDINNSKAGTFNSYSLSLLVIFHFQTCVPAIFPPLRDIYPWNAVDDLVGLRASAEENIAKTCAVNIARFRSDRSRLVNRSSLSELFVSFLAKFSDIDIKAPELGVCPFTGSWEAISSNMRWLPKTYSLFIEDPFEQPENAGRSVSARKLTQISQVFRMSLRSLTAENRNQSSLLAALMRPRVSQFTAGSPVRSLGYNGGRRPLSHNGPHKMQPQNPKPMPAASRSQPQFLNMRPVPRMQNQFQNGRPEHMPLQMRFRTQGVVQEDSASQTQHQLQYVRPVVYGNGSTLQRAVHRHQSQGQHMWRPKYPS